MSRRKGGRKQRQSGNRGHRLQYTAAPTRATRKQQRARKAQPVTVTHADGRQEVRPAESFKKPRTAKARGRAQRAAKAAIRSGNREGAAQRVSRGQG